jgi:hypothetical protein
MLLLLLLLGSSCLGGHIHKVQLVPACTSAAYSAAAATAAAAAAAPTASITGHQLP